MNIVTSGNIVSRDGQKKVWLSIRPSVADMVWPTCVAEMPPHSLTEFRTKDKFKLSNITKNEDITKFYQ